MPIGTYLFRGPERGEVIVFAGDEPDRGDDGSGFGDIMTAVGQFLGVVPAAARDFVKRVIWPPGHIGGIEGDIGADLPRLD